MSRSLPGARRVARARSHPAAAEVAAAALLHAAWTAGLVATLVTGAGCGGPRRPPPLRPDRDPLVLLGGTDGAPKPTREGLLAKYPLGDAPVRADLLALTEEYSVFLFQSREGVPRHLHRSHRERAHVLSGSGTCYVDTRSYPAVAGSSFKIEPGLVHRVDAAPDEPMVLLVVFEPPLGAIEDDFVKVGD